MKKLRAFRKVPTLTLWVSTLLLSFISLSQSFSQTMPSGKGTLDEPFLISNAEELEWLGNQTNADGSWSTGKYFYQTADIDLSGIANWTPIGSLGDSFRGYYDGGGHEIQNLNITGTDNYVGLFGHVTDVTITNLNVQGDSISGQSYVGGAIGAVEGSNSLIQNVQTNIAVYGSGTRIGGVVGNFSGGQLINCGSMGNVYGSSTSVGGSIGFMADGKIQNNFSKGLISTSSVDQGSIGGIIGRIENADTISLINAYSSGSVTAMGNSANEGVGGIIGRIESGGVSTFIQHVFSAAALSENSGMNIGGLVGYSDVDFDYDSIYWDTVATGIQTTYNNLGTPLDSAQAKSDSIYKAAGWKFMGTSSGTSDYWGYNGPSSNDGYPFLFFEQDLVQTGCNVSMAGACFSTLKLAFDSINTGSIAGDIEIRINHSTVETSTATLTRNLSATGSTLTIYPAKSGVVIGGNIAGPIIQLGASVSHVTIDGRSMEVGVGPNMTIQNDNTSSGAMAVSISGGASKNTVQYTNLACGKGSADNFGVLTIENGDSNTVAHNYVSGTSSLDAFIGIYLKEGSNNFIRLNRIGDFFDRNIGATGIYVAANVAGTRIQRNTIFQTDSVLTEMGSNSFFGMRIYSGDSTMVDSNTITGIFLNGGFELKGIYLELTENKGSRVSNNIISNLSLFENASEDHGVIGIDFNSTDVTDSLVIYNNFIRHLDSKSLNATSRIRGIQLSGGRAVVFNNLISISPDSSFAGSTAGLLDKSMDTGNAHELYFNTLYLGGTANGDSISAALWVSNGTPVGRKIKNNLLSNYRSNTGGSALHYALFMEGNPELEIDYNNYYVQGVGGMLGYYNTDIDTITEWRLATRLDCNSFDFDPDLVIGQDDSITHYVPGMDSIVGLNIDFITQDINQSTRNAPPAMGAIELMVTTNDLSTPIELTGFSPEAAWSDSMITITGHHLYGVDSVFFNGILADSISVIDSTTIQAWVPTIANPSSTASGYIRIAGPCESVTSTDKFYQIYFAGGDGSTANPYEIEGWGHLHSIRYVEDSLVHFELTANLDSNSASYDSLASSISFGGKGWMPIGNLSNPFNGELNGGDFSIRDLVINRPDIGAVGLFGVSQNAVFKNLNLTNLLIEGRDSVGSLSGVINGSLGFDSLLNVHISNTTVIGGSNSSNNGLGVGGMVGIAKVVYGENLHSDVTVKGNRSIGGLFGELQGASSIRIASTQVSITENQDGNSQDFGGFVGKMYEGSPLIELAFSKGSVDIDIDDDAPNSNGNIGGFVGKMDDYALIKNAYSTVDVAGPSQNGTGGMGGFAGAIIGDSIQIVHAYAAGMLQEMVPGIGVTYGGLVGEQSNPATVVNSFWDSIATGIIISAAGTGKDTSGMKSELTFAAANWDFGNERVNGDDDYWFINDTVNAGYPFLYWENLPNESVFGGSLTIGSSSDPGGWKLLEDSLFIITDVVISADTIVGYMEQNNQLSMVIEDQIVVDSSLKFILPGASLLTMEAGGDIIFEDEDSIYAQGGALDVVIKSNMDSIEGGMFWMKKGSRIFTNGGDLWIGGGSGVSNWNDLQVGDGMATAKTLIDSNRITGISGRQLNGITLDSVALITNDGDLYLGGQSINDSIADHYHGVLITGGSYIKTRSGSIQINGNTSDVSIANEVGSNYGVFIHATGQDAELVMESTIGSISIEGQAHSIADTLNGAGLAVKGNGNEKYAHIISTMGTIELSGSNLGTDNVLDGGLVLDTSTAIYSTGGNISLLGASNAPSGVDLVVGGNNKLGQFMETPLHIGNLFLSANSMRIDTSARIQSAGSLSIYTQDSSLTIGLGDVIADLQLPSAIFENSLVEGFKQITVGRSTHAARILTGRINIKDDLILENSSGDLLVMDTLQMTAQTLTLKIPDSIFQGTSGALQVNRLALVGDAHYILNSAYNLIDTLAAGDTLNRVKSLSLRNASKLVIDEVNPIGIYATGPISIATLSGDLVVGQNISTTNASTSAIRLYADSTRLAGDSTGGQIILQNDPILTTGTGGRVTLYTGNQYASTGVWDYLVDSTFARFDIAASTPNDSINPVMTVVGTYALYRDIYDRITDTDKDGVPDGKEVLDGTMPLDSCSFLFTSVDTNRVSESWKMADCDGDGISNITEIIDSTDPTSICSYNRISWLSGTPIPEWANLDCDGDGVINSVELLDGSNELDGCEFVWQRQEQPDSMWMLSDCDGDGIPNGTEFNFLPRYNGSGFIPRDVDQDSIPNFRDTDSDGDGVPDSIEYFVDSTNVFDFCDFLLYSSGGTLQSDTSSAGSPSSASSEWRASDCDQDGVSNYQEILDDTDPLDICSFDPSSPVDSTVWRISDCDGDGVTNEQEQMDGTDLNDMCDFLFANVDSILASTMWKTLDCDGDGVNNLVELRNGDDGVDPCDLMLDDQGVPTAEWEIADCDGDGISNGEEVNRDGTDPFDPCDYDMALQALASPSVAWLNSDCDGDGVSNEVERNNDLTDLRDGCDFVLGSIDTSAITLDWANQDCDGDGVNNINEIRDETDPQDGCDWVLAHVDETMAAAAWRSLDCDGDGFDNEWETSDEDGDGIWNGIEQDRSLDWMDPCSFDLNLVDSSATSVLWDTEDCDGDGIPNKMELRDGSDPQDGCSIDFASADFDMTSEEWNALDCDGDGIINQDESNLMGFSSQDVDNDSIPNFLDEDSDGDGMLDSLEQQQGTDPFDHCDWKMEFIDSMLFDSTWMEADCDGDGVSNLMEWRDSTNGMDGCDFVVVNRDLAPTSTWLESDCDGDGLTNEEEGVEDTDGNGVPDFLGDDSDGDGVSDSLETEDGTDRYDACSFVLTHVDTSGASQSWNTSDCDGDGVPNLQEMRDKTDPLNSCGFKPSSVILDLVSEEWKQLDCDNDSIPNGLEGIVDTDGDGMPDFNDRDSDWDGMLDEEEYNLDTDPKNLCSFVLSAVDTSFASVMWKNSDCDGDGVPNIVEVRMGTDPLDLCDFFVSAIVDSFSVTPWNLEDCDGDGIDNDLEGYMDLDGDGLENFRDEDADGDGVPDSTEIRQMTGYLDPCHFDSSGLQLPTATSWKEGDCDEDGWTNEEEGLEDIDGDGVPNYLDEDSDGDGVLDHLESKPFDICQYDEDLVDTSLVTIEWRGLDCDGDGVLNMQEWLDSTSTLDGCDFNIAHVLAGTASEEWHSSDCDGDGWTNEEEGLEDADGDGIANFLDEDADGDGVTDAQEKLDETGFLNPCDFEAFAIDESLIAPSWEVLDCDQDGVLNLEEYLNGDTDEDGIPDLVDIDADGDGVIDSLDSKPLDGCVFDSALVDFNLTALSWRLLDCDGDGVINGIEWEDETGVLQGCDFKLERVDTNLVAEVWSNGDCDGDGITNGAEGYDDFDGDGFPSFLDSDSDNDGVPDEMDACMNTPLGEMVSPNNGCSMVQIDGDGDRVPDEIEILSGTDPNDGCSFEVMDIDEDLTSSPSWDSLDCDGDGIVNMIEGILDLDGDQLINLTDIDADGDGVLDSIEYFVDQTDFLNSCEFEIGSLTEPVSNLWLDGDCDNDGLMNEEEQYLDTDGDGLPNYLDEDSDGDGVSDFTEVFVDFTDHLSTCSFILSSVTLAPSATWSNGDCDGDGVSNGNEVNNGTDPLDICSFDIASVGFASFIWSNNDCDGDGVSNGTEARDGTDPLDPCSLLPSSVHLTASEDWLQSDCDGDGIENQIDGLVDTDEDGTPNFLDADSDMDGILDVVEGLRDINRDSIYDFLQPNTMPDSTEEVKVYSGISPNGDGMNDFLIIFGADKYPENKLSIYNRWGNLIYEESGYGHNGVFFEGYASGSSTLLPDGVYFYVFEYRLETRELKMVQGFFQIHR